MPQLNSLKERDEQYRILGFKEQVGWQEKKTEKGIISLDVLNAAIEERQGDTQRPGKEESREVYTGSAGKRSGHFGGGTARRSGVAVSLLSRPPTQGTFPSFSICQPLCAIWFSQLLSFL